MGRGRAALALLLLVPAPTVGVLAGMVVFPNSLLGTFVFGAGKLWLFGLPLVWRLVVDREPMSLSPPRHGGFAMGALSGVLISAVILAAYLTIGETLIDRSLLVDRVTTIGLGSPAAYLGAAAYWILVNSVLEEYAWRWFCVKQCEVLLPSCLAVACSALFFTLHHTVAMAVYLRPAAVVVCSVGVFLGAAVWSMLYIRYRSIWPGYLSHALVDLCVLGLGGAMVF